MVADADKKIAKVAPKKNSPSVAVQEPEPIVQKATKKKKKKSKKSKKQS